MFDLLAGRHGKSSFNLAVHLGSEASPQLPQQRLALALDKSFLVPFPVPFPAPFLVPFPVPFPAPFLVPFPAQRFDDILGVHQLVHSSASEVAVRT